MDVAPSTPRTQAVPGPAPLAGLQRMVVKQHLHLGGLRADKRRWAPGCVSAGLAASVQGLRLELAARRTARRRAWQQAGA